MAKRKGANISEAIRNYLKDHADEGPTAAAAAISKQVVFGEMKKFSLASFFHDLPCGLG